MDRGGVYTVRTKKTLCAFYRLALRPLWCYAERLVCIRMIFLDVLRETFHTREGAGVPYYLLTTYSTLQYDTNTSISNSKPNPNGSINHWHALPTRMVHLLLPSGAFVTWRSSALHPVTDFENKGKCNNPTAQTTPGVYIIERPPGLHTIIVSKTVLVFPPKVGQRAITCGTQRCSDE